MDTIKKYRRRKSAAEFLQEHFGFGSERWLAKLATVGGGPPFRRSGRIVLYEDESLLNWGNSRLSRPMSTTSDVEVL